MVATEARTRLAILQIDQVSCPWRALVNAKQRGITPSRRRKYAEIPGSELGFLAFSIVSQSLRHRPGSDLKRVRSADRCRARPPETPSSAALGLLTRLADLTEEEPESAELSKAVWRACAGGQRRAAESLLCEGPISTGCPTTETGLSWTQRSDWGLAKRMSPLGSRNRRPLGRFGIGRPPRSPDHSLGQLGHGTIRMVSNRPTYPMRSIT